MSRDRRRRDEALLGAHLLRQAFPLLAPLAAAGRERDRGKNRRLTYAQYAGLILVGLFNPLLGSARALVAASGTRGVRRLAGGRKVSLGSFSEAARVFEPGLLAGLAGDLRVRLDRRDALARLNGPRPGPGPVPDRLVDRLVAVDGSVLTALPGLAGRAERWRLHVLVAAGDRTARAAALTRDPTPRGRSEPAVAAELVAADAASDVGPGLYLMDRGYRSAPLLNTIAAAGGDYVCRLNRDDGKPAGPAAELSAAAVALGVVADEPITFGRCDHAVRRITLLPPAGTADSTRPAAVRQGRPRADQSGRGELVLATTLSDVPAEEVVAIYERRWQVELFFRFLKHTLGCERLLSTKEPGIAIQLYCALIAGLLLALAGGGNLTRRQYEMVCLFLAGWADEDDLAAALGRPPPSDAA